VWFFALPAAGATVAATVTETATAIVTASTTGIVTTADTGISSFIFVSVFLIYTP
jgi:hypothetical protein